MLNDSVHACSFPLLSRDYPLRRYEAKRQIIVELLCAAKGTKPEYIGKAEMAWMFSRGDGVVYPKLVRRSE